MAEKITTTIAASIVSLSLTTKLIVLSGLVILGANSYAIQAYRKAKADNAEFGKLDYFQSLVGGVFSGCIFFLMSIVFSENEIVSLISGGIGAFMGFAGITRVGDLLINVVESKLKKQ